MKFFIIFYDKLSIVFSVLPLNWTVGMVGVLAGTIEDAFIVSVSSFYMHFLDVFYEFDGIG